MSNTGVTGRVTDEAEAPLAELTVVAYELETFTGEEPLGLTHTSVTGDFTITYPDTAYGLEAQPDLKLRIFDPVGRLLFESNEYQDVKDTTLDIGHVIIPYDVARGYRVTLRKGYLASSPPTPPSPSDLYPLLSQGNFVKPLIDNDVAWAELTADVKASTDFVHLLQLWFSISNLFTVFGKDEPKFGSPTIGDKLGEVLLDKNRTNGVEVRILLWHLLPPLALLPLIGAYVASKYLFDSVEQVKKYLADENNQDPHTIEWRAFSRPFNATLHAKIVVIDSKTAYILGSPFIQGYYDDQNHSIFDPRRGINPFQEHTDGAPVHEVSVSLKGPAVEALNNTFLELWGHVGASVASVPHTPPPETNAAVQIVRTIPGNLLMTVPDGETGILEAYQRAIREAKHFIYLDNQYFTEPLIADALVQALEINQLLQVIMVLNPKVDIPGYFDLQCSLIERMREELGEHDARLGIFSLWSHDTIPIPQRILRIYTHAKVAIVDDKWATIGCANLDGVGLNETQFLPSLYTGSQAERRSVEVNTLVFNGVDGLPASTVPNDLRRALWAELLGYSSPNHPELQTPPREGGWLALWNDHAAAKLSGLIAMPPTPDPARILKWCPETDPAKHLMALGLTKANLAHLTIEHGRSFNFATGEPI